MGQPLTGLRVLDLTQVMAGPYCSQILADLGAHVTKVEPAHGGDASREGLGTVLPGGESSAFLALNRNKRSIAVDLKTAEGQTIVLALARQSDVMVESFRPGVTTRLGIDYESVRALHPAIVYASISGFGQDGPYADRAGYDLMAQAMSGVMSVTGHADGDPVKAGIPIADLSAGMFCTIGLLAAVTEQRRSGTGRHVDVSLFESAFALSIWETAEYWATGTVPERTGSAHRMSAPYQAVRSKDGHLVLGANNSRLWAALCAALERSDLVTDPRFRTNADRVRHRAALIGEIEATTTQATTAQWVEHLLQAGLPAAPIQDYAEVCNDPHVRDRELVVMMQHPAEGRIKALATPITYGQSPATPTRPPPLLGQHTDEVLTDLGYAEQERRQLFSAGVVT